ncbi:MAG: signal recognition particle-docking protein FtsY [Gammaproteobacteria bacterium RIFCSPLOWO2_02_FULL_56_15]|nr:MAG: signal recognition particle-docking protein FtsY [Gammaproteobacteria bacterium RIFCSPLOWO2_02_FULL_56_15]
MFGLKKKSDTEEQGGVLGHLRQGLRKTRDVLFMDIEDLFQEKGVIDETLLDELENRLLQADLGVEATTRIMETLRNAVKKGRLNQPAEVIATLRQQMIGILLPVEHQLELSSDRPSPQVILVVGVNGVGKTTTIGKLAAYYHKLGHRVLLAAGDTFRAAAIEQIQAWGKKTGIQVIAQHSGADAAAVIYDALQSARAHSTDILIADTAGRLHNKDKLMGELAKIRRTISRFDPELPVEVMLVLDAATGQNAMAQAEQFHRMTGVTGITLTKLDGTAKGGMIFALASKMTIPLRFIGIGEQVEDLRPFEAEPFVKALIDTSP